MSKEILEKLRKGLNNKHLSDAQRKSVKAKIESLEKLDKKSEPKAEKKVAALKDKIKEEESKESKSKTKLVDELLDYKNILRNIDKYPNYSKKNVEQIISELENKVAQKTKSAYQSVKKVADSKKAKEAKPKKEVKVSAAMKKEMKRHTQGRSKSNLARDAKRSALKGGKRISANGNVYYEYRPNHSDINPRTRLEKGGSVEGDKFTYMMLGRLQSDNDYYLGNGNRSANNLWAGNVDAQIKEMKRLWNSLPENGKPEWLSMEDIKEYEKEMTSDKSEDFDAYKVVEPKGKKSDYKIVTGFDHKNNHELYHVVGIDNDYVGEWHKDKKDAEAELKDLNGISDSVSKFANGGSVDKINWQNFTLNELQDYITDNYSSDIQLHTFSPLKEVRTNNGTELKQDDFISIGKISKKDKDAALSIGHGKQVEVTSGSENIYLNIVVYDKSDKPLMLSIYTKEDKKGIKKLSSEIIEKFAKGGSLYNNVDTELIDSSAKNIYNRQGFMALRNTFLQVAKTDEMAGDKATAEYRRKVVLDYQKKEPKIFAKGGSIATCPVGTKIQTIIFSKEFYNKTRAVKWLDKNNFKGTIADDKSTTVRFRQASPDKFKEDTFRTIELTKGVKAVIGCPIEKMAKGGNVDDELTLKQLKNLNGKIIDSPDLYKKIRHQKDVMKISMLGIKEKGLNKYEVLLKDKSSIYIYMD